MRSMIRRTTVALLLAVFLGPGLLQARTSVASWKLKSVASPVSEVGFFRMVWNLLVPLWEKDDNGGQLDPSGNPVAPGTSSTTDNTGGTDNGGQLDPSGG
jgi:hypothetical protein